MKNHLRNNLVCIEYDENEMQLLFASAISNTSFFSNGATQGHSTH